MRVYLKFVRHFFCYLFCISCIIRYYDEPSTISITCINNILVHNPKQIFFLIPRHSKDMFMIQYLFQQKIGYICFCARDPCTWLVFITVQCTCQMVQLTADRDRWYTTCIVHAIVQHDHLREPLTYIHR